MAEPRHSVDKKRKCDIEGCDSEGERSVSGKKVENAGMSISSSPDKNAHLCKTHYREFKKKTKSDRTMERLGW